MINGLTLRRPKLYFDVAADPSHLTLDDGRLLRRNLPWVDYVGARWEYLDPDVIHLEIGDWLVAIRGHNLDPLFAAIEEHTLLRVRAQPHLEGDGEHELDTFVLKIQFVESTPGTQPRRRGQMEFDLGE